MKLLKTEHYLIHTVWYLKYGKKFLKMEIVIKTYKLPLGIFDIINPNIVVYYTIIKYFCSKCDQILKWKTSFFVQCYSRRCSIFATLWFSGVFRGCKMGILVKNELSYHRTGEGFNFITVHFPKVKVDNGH